MKSNLLFAILTMSTLLLTSCQQQEASKADMAKIKTEIQAAENAWADALNAKDIDALMAMFTEDAVSMPDDAPMLKGKDAIRKHQEKDFSNSPDGMTYTFETLDVYGHENVVTETGLSTYKDSNGKVVGTGKYMVVWEKQNDKYLCVREIYNNDSPPAPSNVRSIHLFDMPTGLTESEWLATINELNDVIADEGYPGVGYHMYKSEDEEVKDYRYYFEGVWPSEEVYQEIREIPAVKALYDKSQSQYDKIEPVEIYRKMTRIQ